MDKILLESLFKNTHELVTGEGGDVLEQLS